MHIAQLEQIPNVERIGAAFPAWRVAVDQSAYRSLADPLARSGARLIALWGSDDRHLNGQFGVHAAFAVDCGLLWVVLAVATDATAFPSLATRFPAANRMERALSDLLGLPSDNPDSRRWLRHGGWRAGQYPLRRDFAAAGDNHNEFDDYAFVQVAGEGVHEIPVGPVHAGIIEPGHFRFSVVGEKMLRLEQRLGYKHKGIEKRFEGMGLMEGGRLAGRVSGDSTVAHAFAYAQAVESLTRTEAPARAQWLRALALERERVANHLGDLGALGNDAGLGFALSQFSRLKEEVLRANRAAFGHRYLMDFVIPGGVARDIDAQGPAPLQAGIASLEKEVARLRDMLDEHAGLQDRLVGTGIVDADRALRLGMMGVAGRASAQQTDLRVRFPVHPYDALRVRMAGHAEGDVAARFAVRMQEIGESLRLQREILSRLPDGAVSRLLHS
ncbi:MAG: NADH-quinone oxidoreductase subunit C, partial [Burkholderiales bacterium]